MLNVAHLRLLPFTFPFFLYRRGRSCSCAFSLGMRICVNPCHIQARHFIQRRRVSSSATSASLPSRSSSPTSGSYIAQTYRLRSRPLLLLLWYEKNGVKGGVYVLNVLLPLHLNLCPPILFSSFPLLTHQPGHAYLLGSQSILIGDCPSTKLGGIRLQPRS
ncbi:hypothetical protein F4801DRAFT_177502 [Xylaria longipes]|nr:hypothetical protein F4801DRAFT_177502 [Xylaria longipes]